MSTRRRSHSRKTSARPSRASSSIRYVNSEARDVFDLAAVKMMREMCRAMETATEPLDGERLASQLHGRMWQLRRHATTQQQPDWSFGLGAPFAREIARIGGSGAKGLLLTLGYQAPARLAALCAELAHELDVPTPAWAEQVPLAQLTRAAVTAPEDVRMIALEFRRGPHQPFTLSVMVRESHDGIAAHYALMRPFDAILESGPGGQFTSSGIVFSPIRITDACRQVEEAIRRADAVEPSRLVDIASAKELRALTLGRVRGVTARSLSGASR